MYKISNKNYKFLTTFVVMDQILKQLEELKYLTREKIGKEI